MEELLQAPTEGYGKAIFILEINADHFEIKTNLLQLVQANPYHGFERENHHTHINNFKRITSTLKFRDVPSDVIKLMMFPYSLEGNARVWDNTSKSDDMIDKLADQISNLVDIFAKKMVTPAPLKAVEESCITCGRAIPIEINQVFVLRQTLPKPNIPYPLRFNDQKLREKATNQMEKFFQIFQDLHFDIRMDVCHALADLDASINLMPLSIWKNLSPPELTPTRMTLELADRSITHPKGVTEDVFVKVGKFYFPTDFVVVDFEADPRVPLILGRSFLRTGRALINIYGEGITLRVNDEADTFNLNQTTRYSSTHDDLSVNRIDIIDVAREEYDQEFLGFSSNFLGGNPTLTFEPILSDSSPSFIPFEGSDFILEEIDAYLKDESILPEIDHADCDPEGDICLIEKLLNDDPFQLPPMDLMQGEVVKTKSSIEEPPKLELKELPSHLEYAYLEGVDKLPVIILKDLKVDEKEALLKVLKSHKRAIAWKINGIKGIDPRFYTPKILKEEDYKPAVQSQIRVNPEIHEDCIDAFETLKKKLTEAPILVVPDWNLAFELMCDASDFAIGTVLGQRKTKHFQPIHYASKTMTEAQIHYTMTEKEMLSLVYAFEKFQPYLVLSKSIVYTDHSVLKYLLSKQDTKPRLIRWVLLLQEFDIINSDKKGTENLAADHFSRLENPHKDVFENKHINENFPLETLGKISSRSTPWFADFVNFHAGNFIVKGMSSQQKKKFFKDVKLYFWDDLYLF
uniref:Reverse transcriptase domain-containing protein n=1 Tax=Tanacetum cinerariifolium TaxID=118510 RepID=A0A6L2KFT0_TANCI|nr:reverse transcriptase domain-containing protein [Tanacetum cinerariifolium]